jgi:hypothetical protein
MSANLVPLPYSRVAVQHVDFDLSEAHIAGFMRGKRAWYETDYVVFRRGSECAVAEVHKGPREDLFCKMLDVDIVSQTDATRWIDDFTVDTGNPSALATKAKAMGLTHADTLVVAGLYEHVNFIHRPEPVHIDVYDVSPPDPPRLFDIAQRVLASRSFPAIVLNPHIQSVVELACRVDDKAVLFPCGVSQLKRTTRGFFLDERPARQDWVLVGCERSGQIHRHLYGDDAPRIDLCPKKLFRADGSLNLIRCCMVEGGFQLSRRIAVVPWGAGIPVVEEALRALLALRGSPTSADAGP